MFLFLPPVILHHQTVEKENNEMGCYHLLLSKCSQFQLLFSLRPIFLTFINSISSRLSGNLPNIVGLMVTKLESPVEAAATEREVTGGGGWLC